MTLDTALQVVGFAAVLAGYGFYNTRPRVGAAVTVVGAACITVWCLMQPVVGYGVLGIQLAALGINIYNACKRAAPIDYMSKCKRRRTDGPTPCLCCPGECVGWLPSVPVPHTFADLVNEAKR